MLAENAGQPNADPVASGRTAGGTSGNGERCLFRYYDPKVFAHLRWILNAAQLGELFGPVSGWTYWLDGGWRLASPAPRAAGRALAIDAQQGEHLRRVAAINALLAELPASPRRGCLRAQRPPVIRLSPAHSATAGATSGTG